MPRIPPFEVAWLVPSYPWPGDETSGAGQRTQARALAAHGVRVRVVAPVPWVPRLIALRSARLGRYARAPRFQVDGEIRVVRPRHHALPGELPGSRPDWFIARSAMATRAEWSDARLVHAQSAGSTGLAARLVGRWTGLPYVVTVQGDDVVGWPSRRLLGLSRLRATLRGAARVVAVSDAVAERIRELAGVDAVTLLTGIDQAGFLELTIPRDEARRLLELAQDRIVVVFDSPLVPEGGVRELVDAVLELGPPFVAVVIGGGPLAGYRAPEAAERDLVRYLGPQDGDEVARIMSAGDLLVHPAPSGLPAVLLHAACLGLPVIAGNDGGAPLLLGRSRGTILKDRSSAGILAALRRFANDPERARAAGARLRTHVRLAHDVGRNAARLADVYRDVLATSRIRRR
jgi:glycosyltransferase involved in cell wall biosynthesis